MTRDNTQSDFQKSIQAFLAEKGYKRTRVQKAFGDQLVTYEVSPDQGLMVYEYEDGSWDIGHAYASKAYHAASQRVVDEFRELHGAAKASGPRTIIVEQS
jgi:hypothetical protein